MMTTADRKAVALDALQTIADHEPNSEEADAIMAVQDHAEDEETKAAVYCVTSDTLLLAIECALETWCERRGIPLDLAAPDAHALTQEHSNG